MYRAIFRLVDFRLDPGDGAVEGLLHGMGLGPIPFGEVEDLPGDLLLSLPFRSNSRSGTSMFRIPLGLFLLMINSQKVTIYVQSMCPYVETFNL